VISHDRYFLNQIIDEVWKIEGKDIRIYAGNYKNFEEEEITHLELLGRKFKDATRRKENLLESAKKNRQWAAAAGSKNLRIVAERMERDAERIEIGINPKDLLVEIIIKFANIKLHKCQVFEFFDLAKSFGNKILFEKCEIEIDNGEKVAIIGKNGAGKTTLLKMIMGLTSITNGSIKKRSKLSIGYFDQELKDIDPNKTVMEYLTDICRKDEGKIISALRKFGFEKSFQNQKIQSLSGGEKGRLNLLRITLDENEILLLDEPTNNLDLNLKDSLQKAINDFPGTVIIVSHDRYFMNKVATRVLDISDQKISSYDGNYSFYLENKQE
jgi:ATP-binding cassette subfamily F protein 3